MEPRPKALTPEMLLSIGTELASMLAKSGHIDTDQIEASAADIAKVGRRHIDGYELAKALDDRCYWDCNLMMADDLDAFSSLADDRIKAAQREWADRNNVQPPYPIGTKVKNKRGEVGVLDEVYSHGVAQYLVKMDDEKRPTCRSILFFEDVMPVEAAAA
jgi:hypothetical protein